MQSNTNKVSRRTVLQGAAALGGAGLAAGFPGIVMAQGTALETKAAKLGFIALTDASPLIIAKEKKLFDKYGITDADVAKQASWGTTRDNMVLGSAAGGSLPATGQLGGVHRLKWVTCCTATRPHYRHRSDAAWPKQR